MCNYSVLLVLTITLLLPCLQPVVREHSVTMCNYSVLLVLTITLLLPCLQPVVREHSVTMCNYSVTCINNYIVIALSAI